MRRFGDTIPTPGSALPRLRAGAREEALPTVIHPAAAIILHYGLPHFSDWVHSYKWEILVEDAAGQRYGVPYSPGVGFGPEGF